MNKIDYEKITQEAIDNIRSDRTKAKDLLNDLFKWVVQGGDRHSEVASSLAKYMETLQRSNEQMVKIAALAQKETKESIEFDDEERDAIFEKVKEEQVVSKDDE